MKDETSEKPQRRDFLGRYLDQSWAELYVARSTARIGIGDVLFT